MAIIVESLSYSYDTGAAVLSDVSLRIEPGERVAIIGENGAGKTTLSKLLNNILTPTAGRVLIDDVDTSTATTAEVAQSVGYVFQNPNDQIFNSRCDDEVAFVPRARNLPQTEVEQRVTTALELTGLIEQRETHPYDLPIPHRRFLTIASVIAAEPRYVIFDEPTAGQDDLGRDRLVEVMKYLSDKGTAVVIVSHDMDFVAGHFPRVIAMSRGKLCADAPTRDVFARPDVLQQARVQPPEYTKLAAALPGAPVMLNAAELADATLMKSENR